MNKTTPQPMEKRAPLTLEALLLLAVFGLFSLVVFASDADKQVTISGRVLADQFAMNDAIVVVELENQACLRSELHADGRFAFTLPVGVKARLIFLKPGYLAKAVVVDTRNALVSDQARRLNKNVRFDVLLDEELQHLHETYLGPVGYITFVNGTGLMRVRHDERMTSMPAPVEDNGFAVIP